MKFSYKNMVKSALVGAALAVTPIAEMIPGVTGQAFAQNICPDGSPFRSKRKTQTMSQSVYKKVEKILEFNDLVDESRKQIDSIEKQIKDLEKLAASKDMKKEAEAAEAKALLAQAAALKPQISPLTSAMNSALNSAEELVKDVLDGRRTSSYERASMLQFYSQINYARNDTGKALQNLEEMLNYGSNLKELREHAIIFNVVQLHYAEGNYDKSIDYLDKWFAMNDQVCHTVTITQNVFISQIYMQKQDYENVLKYIYAAINLAEADPEIEVKEQWYLIAANAHYNLKQLDKYRDVVETLTVKFGKPDYYKRLASIYSELGKDKIFYALYEAIYEMGWMNKSKSEIKTVVQIQFAQGSIIKAAWIMEAAMADGRMERNVENMRMLGQAYMASTEYGKAVAPMTYVARETKDAQAFYDVASIEYANGNMANAIKLYDEAIRLYGEEKRPDSAKIEKAKIGKAASLMDMKRIMDACKVFKDVERTTKSPRTIKTIGRFKTSIMADIAREDMLEGKDSGRKCK